MKLQPRTPRVLMALLIMVAVPVFLVLQAGDAWFSRSGVLFAAFFGSNFKAPATDFELADLNGSLVRLSKYRGDRPVLLYFWATWCPYCVSIKGDLAKLRQRINRSDMEILAINVGGGDSLEKVKKYQEGHPAAWPVLYDGEGKVSRAYKVQGIPLFVLVDKEGNVVYRDTNPPSDISKYLH